MDKARAVNDAGRAELAQRVDEFIDGALVVAEAGQNNAGVTPVARSVFTEIVLSVEPAGLAPLRGGVRADGGLAAVWSDEVSWLVLEVDGRGEAMVEGETLCGTKLVSGRVNDSSLFLAKIVLGRMALRARAAA